MEDKNTKMYVKSESLTDDHRRIADILLRKSSDILEYLASKGMKEDAEEPYSYYIPIKTIPYDDENGKKCNIGSLLSIVLMARASYAVAGWQDCDEEGFPEISAFTGVEEGFHRVYVTDPFAMYIDNAIRNNEERLLKSGEARIVNGKMYKVA